MSDAWWMEKEDPNGWDVPSWVEDPAADRLFHRELKSSPVPADHWYSELHHPERKDTTVKTVADIQQGQPVKVTISSGQVILDCQTVYVVRMLERDGAPKFAHLNNNDRDQQPMGGRTKGPLVGLDHPATQADDGSWTIQL